VAFKLITQGKDKALLSRIFSPVVISELAKSGRSRLLGNLMRELSDPTRNSLSGKLSDCFDTVYEYLRSEYRSEYIYKNAIANKLLIGRHSLKTASMFTEFRILESKADVLILNGTSHIYEIKTELDGLDRLEKQLADYQKFAEFTHVVTTEAHASKLIDSIDPKVGILLLTDRYTLSTLRKASSMKERVETSVIYESLRRSEAIEIVESLGGRVPEVPNGLFYRECLKSFAQLDSQSCHDEMVNVVKRRYADKDKLDFIQKLPTSLKAVGVTSKFNKKQKTMLLETLRGDFCDCLH
jgi:hypothetical protein